LEIAASFGFDVITGFSWRWDGREWGQEQRAGQGVGSSFLSSSSCFSAGFTNVNMSGTCECGSYKGAKIETEE
jgi:hypothetical protein